MSPLDRNFYLDQEKIMRRMVIVVFSIFVSILINSAALAQDSSRIENTEFKVSVAIPDGWEVLKNTGNEKAIANFKHPESQSQLEVVGTHLMTADVAEVFFSTFDKVLVDSNFERISMGEKTYGTYKGTEYEYKFNHSGVTLKVLVFGFMNGDTAWLIVAYVQETERDKFYKDFTWTIENIIFSG